MPIRIRLYSSLRLGVVDKHARGFTQPVVDLLEKRINYPIDFDLADGLGIDGLREFGAKLSSGEIHLGIVWGLEYGWIADEFGDGVRLMAIVSNGSNLGHSSQLMIRKRDTRDQLAMFKGARLAQAKRGPLMDRLFLRYALRDGGYNSENFFRTVEYPTAADAIRAVRDDDADCVVVDIVTQRRIENNQRKIFDELKALLITEVPFPAPVVVGSDQAVNELRPNLWTRMQKELLAIHKDQQGKTLTRFWKFESFRAPDSNYSRALKKAEHAYLIEDLLEARIKG